MEERTERELKIMVPPNMMAGGWANYAVVYHTPHEFTIDFVRITPDPDNVGVVVSRMAVSPLFITQLIDALQRNWDQYAKKAMPKEVQDGDS